jgi:bifunctional DNase/RNase
MSVQKIELQVSRIVHSFAQNNSYTVLLSEVKAKRKLPIVVGTFEAQAIAIQLDKLQPPRPLTHDLIKNMLDAFDIFLKEVYIYNILEGVFYARLICIKDGEEVQIDSRTSDAIALALRFNCLIYTNTTIMDIASITVESSTDEIADEIVATPEDTEDEVTEFQLYTNTELEHMMNESLENEDYEKAALIRDELSKRKL